MWKTSFAYLLMFIFLFCSQGVAQANQIEVMNVKQGKVIKHVPNSEAIQKEVRQFISTIKGLSPSLRIEPRDGMAYKIPVQPPIHYEGKWFSTIIDELFLLVGTHEEPRLLLFDDENRPYVMLFKHDISRFLILME